MTPRLSSAVVPDGRVGFRSALRNRVFARLLLAETQSVVGDQLARVAVSVMVFQATDSVAWTAGVYALTFLPAVLGGLVTSPAVSILGERKTMIVCDVARAVAFAAMAVPGVPLPALVVCLVLAVFLGPLFTSAEVSLLTAVLPAEVFRTATGARMLANQLSHVGGFVAGGLVVAAVDPRGALLLNAASFAASALLVSGLPRALDSRVRFDAAERAPGHAWAGLRRVPGLSRVFALSLLVGFYVVPEGLAVPFGERLGANPVGVGILLASLPLGAVVGVVVVVRSVPLRSRGRTMRWSAVACGLPLVASAFAPTWHLAALCWFASGLASSYQVEALATLMRIVPDNLRTDLIGIGTATLVAAQGLGILIFGAAASVFGTAVAVATAGACGAAAALFLGSPYRSRPRPRHAWTPSLN